MNKEETKKEIWESPELFKMISESTSDLVSITTFSLKPIIKYASPSHKRLLGYEPNDLIGRASYDLIHSDDWKKMMPLLKKYLAMKLKLTRGDKQQDVSEIIEYRVKDKDGKWHYLESTANMIGKMLLFVSKDVTERKQAEKEIKKRNLELEKTNKLMVGREIKMMELKKKIKELEGKEERKN